MNVFNVVLDPGHGEWDNKGAIPGYYEGTQMFIFAEYLKAELAHYEGVQVNVTRTYLQDNPDLNERGSMFYAPDLFLSLHSNATDSPAISGSEIYDSVLVPNRKLADALGHRISGEMGTFYRGTKYKVNDDGSGSDWYGVVRSAVRSHASNAMLIEHGFHTNIKDCQFLLSDMSLKSLAAAEARVIGEHFGLTLSAPAQAPVIYRVQVGAYTVLRNAEFMKQHVVNAGFPGYIVPVDESGFYRVQVGAYSVESNALAMKDRLSKAGFPVIIKKGI